VLGGENNDNHSSWSSTSETHSSSLRKLNVDIINTSVPLLAVASRGGWSHWGSDNFNGVEKEAIICEGSPRIGFQQQRNYGLVDAKLDCDDGTTLRSTQNSNGWSNPWMLCNTQDISGIRVNYQSRYGLVNAECYTDTTCPPQIITSNANNNGWWKRWLICPPGSKIDGLQVREHRGYGLVNLRIHCTNQGHNVPDYTSDAPPETEVSGTCGWDDSLDAVLRQTPILITNIPIHTNEPFDDYSYFEETNGKTPNEPWKFFHNLRFVSGRVQMRELETNDALTNLSDAFNHSNKKAIMFVIHGWNSEARFTLCKAKEITDKTDYLAIPVVWNNHRGGAVGLDYRYDRVHTAPPAGIMLAKHYKSFFHKITAPKNWMCHSLGCFVMQFLASDVYEAGDFDDSNGTKFDDLFFVAPDVRLDIFNEYPYGSGKDKNECEPNQWNTADVSKRIPDCRPGGGDAIAAMVNKKVHVHWNPHDGAGYARSWRLSADLIHTWPISMYGLLDQGPCRRSNTKPLPKFADKTLFIKWDGLEPKKDEHNYQFFDQLIHYYNHVLNW